MNLQIEMPTTADEFLRWEGGGDFRYEFVDGEVVQLPRDATREHVQLATELACYIMQHTDKRKFDVGVSLFAGETPSGIRLPDVFVDVSGGPGTDLTATAPILLAEVLSSWSRERDLNEKMTDYQGIASLRHYMALAQDEARIWLWSRDPTDQWNKKEIAGRDLAAELSSLGIRVPLSEFYPDIGLA